MGRAANGDIFVAVSDTGIGMSADEVRKALLPFGQVDSQLARQHDGTGLGLPISAGLVKAHGGSLTLESVPAHGTTVTVRIPAARILTKAQAAA
jgi:signal transduction histidine kinase